MADLIKKVKIKKQDGTYTDYIPIGAEAKNIDCADGVSVEYKLNRTPYYYNCVADMKADTKLKVGDMAVTLGYYEPNDGGGAEYNIIQNSFFNDNGGSIHKLNNKLFAKLIVKREVNVKQFGAKGNNNHDDYLNIQNCIDYGVLNNFSIYIPNGIYKISQSINIIGWNTSVNAYDSDIRYSGTGSAIIISKYDNGSITLGTVWANNGNTIELYGKSGTEYVQYLNLKWKELHAKYKCIWAHAESNSWVNEIRFYDGRFISGDYGIYADAENRNNLSGYVFLNIGIEGVHTGFYLANQINACWKMLSLRYAEAPQLIKTVGVVSFISIYTNSILGDVVCDFSNQTNHSWIFGKVAHGDGYAYDGIFNLIRNGKIYSKDNTILLQQKNLYNVSLYDMTTQNSLLYYIRFGVGGVATTIRLNESYTTSIPQYNYFYVYDSDGYNTTIQTSDGTEIFNGVIGYNKTLKMEYDGIKWYSQILT